MTDIIKLPFSKKELLEEIRKRKDTSDPENFFRRVLGANTLEDYHLNILENIKKYDRVSISA